MVVMIGVMGRICLEGFMIRIILQFISQKPISELYEQQKMTY